MNEQTRRNFLKTSGALAVSTLFIPQFLHAGNNLHNEHKIPVNGVTGSGQPKKVGIQLYTVKNEMLADAAGTLKQLAAIGYNEIESAKSEKGNYYGLTPKEIKKICADLGISLVSGHVQIDNDWQRSIDQAAEAGQSYLVCSVLPGSGQNVENYQRSADIFIKAGEECLKAGLTFGYHNHDYEFEKAGGQTLYDILLDRTDPKLVKMELDLGWVIATGSDPEYYFNKYPGRFPLWHMKDMDTKLKHSTEFGKGDVKIKALFNSAVKSGLKHFFIEQEEFTLTPLESAKYDYDYVIKMN
ncbi:MAG TPA: sugar phosphate isomerase/epimerase [Pedobacter sp.]